MLVEIGLDTPTPSHEARRFNGDCNPNWHQGAHDGISSPICNCAVNIIALGQHALIPRQRRICEERAKSPLGNK